MKAIRLHHFKKAIRSNKVTLPQSTLFASVFNDWASLNDYALAIIMVMPIYAI
jgi:hypothetical protein